MLNRSAYSVQLPVYEGPLDLLLQLIERAELDITKVALAQVTDQYLGHLRVMEAQKLGEIAEFLVIAAKLILIKSEALLPRPPSLQPGEEDTGEELARQLLAYKLYKEIALSLHEREAAGLKSYLRLAPPPKVEPKLDLTNVTPFDLLQAVQRAMAVLPDQPSLDTVVTPPKVTIRDRMALIRRELRPSGRVAFHSLLADAQSRMEIVVTFLAVLELIKRRWVVAQQEAAFGEILIIVQQGWDDSEEIELEFGE